jgi:glycosyltransferase involved in cell wall biosynthesis
MSKKSLVFQGPVATRSGYGDYARDLAYCLINSGKYDVKIISMPWGSTPMDAFEDDNPKDVLVKSAITKDPISIQPDIFVQVSIPNEFRALGKHANIGITAGIETTQCPPEWLQGLNNMDFNIVMSEFGKKVFLETKYEVRNNQNQSLQGHLENQKPIHVLFSGVDPDYYAKTDSIEPSIKETIDNIDEEFLFLSVGHWLAGDFGEDRKNISGMIHNFFMTFKNQETPPGLVLKTSGATFSLKDKNRIISKIQAIKAMFSPDDKLPNIYLLHGNLSKKEMNSLYNHEKIKAMISYTKGEGFGRPLLEFAVTGKPVIASGFSGHVDFLNPAFHVLLPGKLTEIHKSAVWKGVLNEGTQWFTVDYNEASKILMDIVKNYKKYKYESIKFLNHIHKWSLKEMESKLVSIIEENTTIPEKIELSLPKLKKLPELKKITQ